MQDARRGIDRIDRRGRAASADLSGGAGPATPPTTTTPPAPPTRTLSREPTGKEACLIRARTLAKARPRANDVWAFGRVTQWLECHLHTVEVAGSNPAAPIRAPRAARETPAPVGGLFVSGPRHGLTSVPDRPCPAPPFPRRASPRPSISLRALRPMPHQNRGRSEMFGRFQPANASELFPETRRPSNLTPADILRCAPPHGEATSRLPAGVSASTVFLLPGRYLPVGKGFDP
jgi:hypothetical protein